MRGLAKREAGLLAGPLIFAAILVLGDLDSQPIHLSVSPGDPFPIVDRDALPGRVYYYEVAPH